MSDERASQEGFTPEQHDRQRWLDEISDNHDSLVLQITAAEQKVEALKRQLKANDERQHRIHDEPHLSAVEPTKGKVVPGESGRTLPDEKAEAPDKKKKHG